MRPEEAAQILGIAAHASPEERRKALDTQRTKIEQRLGLAPTEGLKAKYREALRRLDEAYETLELSEDHSDLPSLRQDFSTVPVEPFKLAPSTPPQATPEAKPLPVEKTNAPPPAPEQKVQPPKAVATTPIPSALSPVAPQAFVTVSEANTTTDDKVLNNTPTVPKTGKGCQRYAIMLGILGLLLIAAGWFWLMYLPAEAARKEKEDIARQLAKANEESQRAKEAAQAQTDLERQKAEAARREAKALEEARQKALAEQQAKEAARLKALAEAGNIPAIWMFRVKCVDQGNWREYQQWDNKFSQAFREQKSDLMSRYTQEFQYQKTLAEQGAPLDKLLLGNLYANGIGTATNYIEAIKLFREAADHGLAIAQVNLGYRFANGQGVPKDEVEAVKWYRKAANQSYAFAQYSLGQCCENGQGVPKDEAEAVKWYRKAAEQGFAAAQFWLGVCYASGEGVSEDLAEAVKWVRKAAEQDFAEAQSNLGSCYANGVGVPKDEAEAVKWYRKAAEQGHEDSKQRLAALVK